MFTWICPQCGREVPPSYDECPDCAKKSAPPPPAVAAPPPPQPVSDAPAPAFPPPQQYYQAPPQQPYPPQQYPPQQYPPQPQYPPPQPYSPQQQYSPPQQQYAPPPQQPPYQPPQQSYQAPPPFYPPQPARSGMPTWLMTILCALAFGGVVLGAYYFIGSSSKKRSSASAQDGAPALESVTAANSAARNNPLLKQVEVVGLRLLQNKAKQTEARFVLVNHSGGEIPEFSGTVTLAARTRKKDEEPVGSFSFKAAGMGSYESKEMTAPVDTKLKVYELPDWQNLQAQLEFNSTQ